MYYTTREVGNILSMTDSAVKYNAQKEKLISSSMKGKARLFTKEDIISFAEKYNYEINEMYFYSREDLIELVKRMREEKKLSNDTNE